MASGIKKMEVSIAAQVRAQHDAHAFTMFTEPPCFQNMKNLCEEIAVFTSRFPSNSWGGKHGFLLLALPENKMQIVAQNVGLNCDPLDTPDLVNSAISESTKVRDLLELQEKQKEKWSDYLYQRVLNKIGGEIIISVVPDQYVKPIYKQYIGYNGVTILNFFTQLQTWYVISNGDKLKMMEYFHATWTETPDDHASTYAAQLDKRQIECVNFDVVILDAAKTMHFVGHMKKK